MDETEVPHKVVDDMHTYVSESMRRHRPTLPATGECFYCGDSLAQGERWCDVECRDQWERALAGRGVRR